VLARARLAEGVAGIDRLHTLIATHAADDDVDLEVAVGIETERGPWVQALVASGYRVHAINLLQVARYRETHHISGAKSDKTDAHVLAQMVRTERDRLATVAGDSELTAAIKVVARGHKTMIWEQTRHMLRLRSLLREYYPAALAAFGDLTAPDALELLAKAPDPASGARLTITQITAALQHAQRRKVAAKAKQIQAALPSPQLRLPERLTGAYAATVRSQVAILVTLNAQVQALEEQVETHFGQHPDAEIYLSQPGLAHILGARVLGEFGDDPHRYHDARSRKNYAGTSPITRQSGKTKLVAARHVHNDWLVDVLGQQAFSSLSSPGARAYYQQLRDRDVDHNAALRQLGNRLVGILHGCLKTHTRYDEATAWSHRSQHELTNTA
jgi:transposase